MASLDVRRPAAQEQLAVLGEQAGVATLPIVAGQHAGRDRAPRDGAGRARRLRRGDARHRRPPADRRGADGRGRRRCATPATPAETLLVVDAMTGQDAVNIAHAFNETRRHHRHRADPRRRRRARRRGAVDARGHRRADQAHRHSARSSTRSKPSIPTASPAASSAWATSSRLVEKAAETVEREEAEKLAKKIAEGPVRSRRPRLAAPPDAQDGRHAGHAWACCPASAR